MRKIVSLLLLTCVQLLAIEPHQVIVGKDHFPTLEAARRHIQNLSRDRPVEVTIRPGIYSFESATHFGPKDGGTAEFPVTDRGEGEVIFDGSKVIKLEQFAAVNDQATLAQLSSPYHVD
jgi:hypothetical protein